MQRVARHVTISGRVQGVAFRWYAHERAEALGVGGWIRNCRDGRVEAWVEAEPEPLDEMLQFLRSGPPHAHVRQADVRDREPEGFTTFEIRR